jgi:hypothetical protein
MRAFLRDAISDLAYDLDISLPAKLYEELFQRFLDEVAFPLLGKQLAYVFLDTALLAKFVGIRQFKLPLRIIFQPSDYPPSSFVLEGSRIGTIPEGKYGIEELLAELAYEILAALEEEGILAGGIAISLSP